MVTVCSFLRQEDPSFVADDVVGVHLAQCPNRDHVMPPKIPPASMGSSEDMPAATCTSNVPRHAPVIAMPLPRSKYLMTFLSYQCNLFKFEASRGFKGEIFVRLASSMTTLWIWLC
jgi:hypothetical protein